MGRKCFTGNISSPKRGKRIKEDKTMTAREEKINALFEELVPASGKAATVAGEIIRAISRIGYRNYNDGDHLGVGYGRETCNPAGRYLAAKCDDRIARLIRAVWGEENDSYYDTGLAELEDAILEYIEQHPELKETENTEDMWSYRDSDEDVDEDDYEDDEWEDEEYEDEEEDC